MLVQYLYNIIKKIQNEIIYCIFKFYFTQITWLLKMMWFTLMKYNNKNWSITEKYAADNEGMEQK